MLNVYKGDINFNFFLSLGIKSGSKGKKIICNYNK